MKKVAVLLSFFSLMMSSYFTFTAYADVKIPENLSEKLKIFCEGDNEIADKCNDVFTKFSLDLYSNVKDHLKNKNDFPLITADNGFLNSMLSNYNIKSFDDCLALCELESIKPKHIAQVESKVNGCYMSAYFNVANCIKKVNKLKEFMSQENCFDDSYKSVRCYNMVDFFELNTTLLNLVDVLYSQMQSGKSY